MISKHIEGGKRMSYNANRMIEIILRMQEKHAQDLKKLMSAYEKDISEMKAYMDDMYGQEYDKDVFGIRTYWNILTDEENRLQEIEEQCSGTALELDEDLKE